MHVPVLAAAASVANTSLSMPFGMTWIFSGGQPADQQAPIELEGATIAATAVSRTRLYKWPSAGA